MSTELSLVESQLNEDTKDDVDIQILKYIQTMNQIKAGLIEPPKPTDLRISTISAKCKLSAEVNLKEMTKVFYEKVMENIMQQKDPDYFVQGIQLGSELIGLFKKMNKKNLKIKTKIEQDDIKNIDFYNQCTLLLYSDYNNNQINLKLFRNGSITMTGCKDHSDGPYVVNKMIVEMKKHQQIFEYDEDQKDLHMKDFTITMINSDFFIGYRIDLLKLEGILSKNYDIFFSYDPKVYAAVKVSYMWNKDNEVKNGVCHCSKKCIVSTKKSEKAKNNCNIITVAIFNSGKIIITGSNEFKKTQEAYDYINKLLKENYTSVMKFSVHDCVDEKDMKKNRKGRPSKK